MHTKITSNEDVTKAILDGVEKVSAPVIDSLGPNGANVLIQQRDMSPLVTNDGVTIARSITLEDKTEEQAANSLIQAALRTNYEAGDGTSCTIGLAAFLVKQFYESGLDKEAYIDLIKSESVSVIEEVKAASEEVTPDALKIIAQVSCQNEEVAGHISDVFNELGPAAVINVVDSLSGTSVKVEKGLGIKHGFSNALFCNKIDARKIELNPDGDKGLMVVTYQGEIAEIQKIGAIMSLAKDQKKKLVVVAHSFTPAVLGFMYQNIEVIRTAPIQISGTPQEQKETIDDIETVINSHEYDNSDIEMNFRVGYVDGFDANNNSSVFRVGALEEDRIKLVRDGLLEQLDENKSSSMLRSKLMERMARLDCGFSELKIGGETELEIKELRLRAEDAIMASRAAFDGGVVEGGGVFFNRDFKAYKNLYDAIRKNVPADNGINPLDPAKVVISVVKNATSIVKTLLTVNHIITNEQ